MGSTMNGSMTFALYIVCGTVRFGNVAMDKGMMFMDLTDAREVMDMEDAAGEILGFHKDETYFDEEALAMAAEFNKEYANDEDEFLPTMLALRDQSTLSDYLDYANFYTDLFILIFLVVMSVVLWNTGLIGGLRRYQEFGIRLVLGESKSHLYRAQLCESVLIGIIGSILGTLLGLILVYYLQVHGIDVSGMTPDSNMMFPGIMRAKFTSDLLYIGFIPGVIAMLLGTSLSGLGIYKRRTALLMKEMEI